MSGQRTIQFSVEFVTASNNFKKVINELQQELAKVKPGTQIYESISQQIKQAQQLMRNTDFAIEKGIMRGSDIDRVAQNFDLLTGRINNIKQALSSLTFPDLNLGHSGLGDLGKNWQQAQVELAGLLRQIEQLQNMTVKGALGDKTAGFEGVLDQNALQLYDELIQKATAAKEQVAQLQAEQARLQEIMASSSTITAKQAAASPYEKALSAMGVTGGSLPGAHKIATAMIQGPADTQSAVNTMLQSLGLDKATIDAVVEKANGSITQLTKSLQDLGIGTKLQNAIRSMTGSAGSATSLFSYVEQLRTAAQEAQNAVTQLNNVQQQLNTAQANVSTLEGQKTTLGAVINPSQITDLQTQVSNLMARIANLESQISQKHSSSAGVGKQPPYPTDDPAAKMQLGIQQQQEQLGNAIDSYTKRWIGAYAIINKISSTIKQAWSDIQNLDKAMTSIAVVTDMSVSDLWGKLNEYMRIAQQYGVTTQGVYEVSQIYYQQGLTTNEVMAATTETLKLARIAGMDYAEAADAMTVAIRSFKMEMSDAATITDVYSKVAAITASDSEELAIAMSKTASSAESVGSSFENTTAMLAVMIETTRESAQNLGSALKSIISRYGEMKVGLTVDSEGEEIDYNKVDTALKSVGISIKDAQGQFRDFDDVIFELSEKWDSLDKNTQRYIATIMAGNRQQSRFIALVDNGERLDEVAGAAHNAEDAGLLQYAKTLDSFDAKLNQLKNSFQSFYMSLFDSDAFKGILDVLNDILEGFSKMGQFGVAVIPSLITGFKVAFTIIKGLIVGTFSSGFAYSKTQSQLAGNFIKGIFQRTEKNKEQLTQQGANSRRLIELKVARQTGNDLVLVHQQTEGTKTAITRKIAGARTLPGTFTLKPGQNTSSSFWKGGWKNSPKFAAASMGLNLAGAGLTTYGAYLSGKGEQKKGAWATTVGNVASYAGMGSMFGLKGVIAGGILGLLASIKGLNDAYDDQKIAAEALKKAEEELQEANIKKAEANQEYTGLKSTLEELNRLKKARHESEEAMDDWIEANNRAKEAYSKLIVSYDEAGNIIVDLDEAEKSLAIARKKSATATKEAAIAELERIKAEKDVAEADADAAKEALSDKNATDGALFTQTNSYMRAELEKRGYDLDEFEGSYFLDSQNGWRSDKAIQGPNGVYLTGARKVNGVNASSVRFGNDVIDLLAPFVNKRSAEAINWLLDLNDISNDTAKLWETLLTTFDSDYLTTINGSKPEDIEAFIKIAYGDDKDSAWVQEQIDAIKEGKEYDAIIQSSIQSAVGTYIDASLLGFEDITESFSNVKAYASKYIQEAFKASGETDIITWLEGAGYLGAWQNFSDAWTSVYNNLSEYQRNNVNKLMTALSEGQITLEDFSDQISQYDINSLDDLPGLKTQYLQKDSNVRSRVLRNLLGPDGTLRADNGTDLTSYENWRTSGNYADNAANLEIYNNWLRAEMREQNTRLGNFLADASLAQLEAYSSFYSQAQDSIETGLLSGIYAENQLTAVDYALNKLYNNEDFFGLSDKKRKEFAEIILTNIGTEDWYSAIIQFAQDNQIDITELSEIFNLGEGETLEGLIYENFNTRLERIKNEIISFYDKIKEYAKKQQEGYTWKESEEFLKEYQKFYKNAVWNDLFEINEQGLIVLKNFNKTMAFMSRGNIEKLKSQNASISALLDGSQPVQSRDRWNITSGQRTWIDASGEERTMSAGDPSQYFTLPEFLAFSTNYEGFDPTDLEKQRQIIQRVAEQFELSENLAEQIVLNWLSLDPAERTVGAYKAFMESLLANNEELVDYFEKEEAKTLEKTSYDDFISKKYTPIKTVQETVKSISLDTLSNLVINKGMDEQYLIPKTRTDANGNVTTYNDYDWEGYFSDLEEQGIINIDEYGDALINNPRLYGEYLIELLNISDQAVINDVWQTIFEQYHTQWQERQAELETLFTDYQFTDQEMAKMYAWAISKGNTRTDMSMEAFAQAQGFEEIDGIWEATTPQAYYSMIAYAKSENPDLDFSDLPSWGEWATQRAAVIAEEREKAIKFLRELTNETSPERLNEAIELGLLDADQISEADLEAFKAGNKTIYELIAAQHPNGFTDPKLQVAWKTGQENYNQEVSKWLNDLFSKATLTPTELLEIWELLGAPEGDFDTWAEQGFEYDPKAGNYRVTASSYGVYAQAAAAKGATEMPSRLDFLQTLHAGEKTQTDARTQALSSLSIDATIHDLDAVYQAGLITDEQYLQAIADAAAGRKTYYESIIGFVDRSNKEVDDAVQEIEAKQITSMQADIDSLFGDTTLDNDSIKKMWLDAETDKDMFSWAEEALGVVYENGQWVIKNASQAWATMSEWFKEEYGEDNYAQYMTPEKQQEFQSMWANYQDVQSDSIISFIEGLSPESGEDILSEAVELGLTTWEEIATYKSQGYNAYDTIRAIAEKEGSTWTKEQKTALEEGWKTYQREIANAVTSFFEDGLFSEEDMEKMWIASGSDLSFDEWMGRKVQLDDGTETAFFEKIGDGWVIKSEEAYKEMVRWVADTYGAEFVALLPNYKKLQAMGLLENKRQVADKLEYLSGLTPEMNIEDLEKAVELGILSEDEMVAIVSTGVDYWDAIAAKVGALDAEYQEAFAKSRAKYFDDLIDEAEGYTKDTSWTTEQLVKSFEGTTWMQATDKEGKKWFELNLETGEWEATSEEAYKALKDWITTEYGEAYANLLPSWKDLEGQKLFKNTTKKTGDKVEIIKGLSQDFSLDDLEKLVEAGMLTYQEATAIWSSANPWETLLSAVKLSSQEELDAFNQMVTENNIAMGKAALALFNDSSLTWDEVSTLWANQLGEGGETDIVKWAQSMGLKFIDGEWKITTEEAYNNMVAAAKELYGEAWAEMAPSKEDILAANLLDKQVTRDSKVAFIEGLNFEEITASDMQKAIEQGIITSEQFMWTQENGIDYQTLIGMAISHDQEMVQAFNEGLAEYNLTQRENMMTLFDDKVLSQEQVMQMWHDMGSGQTFDSWLGSSGIEFIDGEFRIDSAAAFNAVKEWAKTYWGDAWDSIPWSTITAEQWEAGMANIKAMETDAAIESFFSDFDTNAGMDEAYKAVELGILTQEQLLHGLAQGFSVWDVVTSYALESTENYSDFIDMINNRTRAEYLSSAFSLGTADSWSSDQIISLWDLNGRTENSNFIDWAQDNGFIINENGQWEASTKEAYQSMLDYIEVTFGAAYANALPTADEWEAANLLEKAETDSDRTDFIKGLTADADVAEILQQAIDYGILDLNDYINEEGKLELPSREQLFADIGANLHTQEDVDAFNEAMLLIEQDRVETVSSLMKDNSFTGTELYKIWKKTAQTGVSFSDWLNDVGFILQKDGTYKAMGEAAYDVMVSYVRDNFGEAFVALLPTKEDWENSKLLEDFHSEMDMGEFLSGLDVNATIEDLDKAAELFGITYTEEQLNAIKEGSKTVYEVILESLAPEDWVDGVFGRTGPMADVVNKIERANRDALIAKLPFGELLTTAEDFTSAAQTLAALGFDEDRYKEILKDGRIGLEDTIAILEESQYYLDAVTVNDEGEVENAGEALFAAAQAYGLSLDSFFEMGVYSPALILERLGLQLDQLTAEQYDSFKTAQSNYAESVSKLFSGTGSAADMEKLLATINYGRDANKQWDYSAFYETAKGIQLDRSKFFEALSILKEQDWELYSSIRETLVSSPELLGESFDSIMEVQQAINELGLEHINLLEEQNAALREQASIYGEIYAQMSMNKSEGWDFLNAELHGNAQNFMSWGESVRGTFEQLGNKDGIEPMAFINMLNYMQQMGTTVETLGGNFASWGELMTSAYSAFGKAIVTGTNVTVDDLGISTENMTSAMFESMQKTARQQVDFLDGQIAMLEGIKAISDIDEGELSIGSIYQTMADEVSKYNAETGSDIKLDNIFITVGGERFSFTEEGIAKAEEKYNTLFADSGISFEHALQTSLGNNFGVVMEGGTIGITPTGVMEVELSVDGAAITDGLSKTNGYLTNINSSLITIVGLLSTGKNPWTAEGAAAYFTDEEGNSVIPQIPEELREWYANLDPISQAIYRNYEKTSGIPFEYSPIASADGYQEGEYGKNIYTITTADGEKITGQQVIIETIDGKATPTYATGLDESGKGINYRALPETAEQQFSQLADIYTNKGFILSSQAMGGLALTEDYSLVNGEWRNSSGELATGYELDRLNALINELETLASVGELTPWEQALYYTAIGQPEKVPGYGVSGKGYTTPGSSTPVNVNTLLQKTNSELDQVVANTAETNALLAAMQGNLDLSTREGAQTYLKTYRNFNEQWQTDSEGFKTWWQGASETDRRLWRNAYGGNGVLPQEQWATSAESIILGVTWEESGLPDDIEGIKEAITAAWDGALEKGGDIPDSLEWMEQYYTPPGQEGGDGTWNWDNLWKDTHLIPWLASNDYGYDYYTRNNTSNSATSQRTLTEAEIAARNAWLFPEGVSGIGAGNVPAGLGFLENDNARLAWLEAAGILNDENRAKYYRTDDEGIHWTPGADGTTPAITELYGTAAFEKAFAEKTGEFLNSYVEAIDDFYDAKALTKGYTRNSDGTITGTNAEGQQVTLSSGEEYEALDSAFDTIANFDKVMTLYSSMLGVPFDPKMFLDAAGNDKILRTSEELAEAADDLATATENLEGATGNLDTSVLRLSQALLASGLLPTYAGINPEELSEWDNAVFNIPGSSEEPSQHELFDTEGILADFATRYAIADTPEVAEAVVADIRSWNGLMKDTYRLMSSISGNVLRTEDADNSSSDVAATSEYQAIPGTQETLDSVNASITTKEAEAGTLRANIAENSTLLAGVRSELATVQSGIVAASEVLANPESTIQQREAALANLTDLQAREADLLRQEAGLIQTINTDRDTLTTTEGELTGLYERQASLLATLSTQQSAVAGLYNQEEADWDDYITELSSILTTLEALKEYYKDEEGNIPDWLTELINYYSTEKTRAEAEKGEVAGKEGEYTTAAGSSSSAAEDAEGKKGRTVVIPDSPGTQSGASTSTKTRDEIVAEYQAIIDELIAARDYDAAGAAIDRYSAEGFIYKDAFAAQKAQWDKYREAMGLLDAGDYAAAKAIFENPEYGLDGFLDSNDQVESLKYTIKLNEVAEAYRLGDLSTFKNLLPSLAETDQAKYADLIGVIEGFNNLINSGDYGAAFELIGTAPKQFQYDFKNGLYRKAITLNQNGEIEKALEILDLLGNFWPDDQPTTAKEFAGGIRFENNLVPEDSVVPPPENPPEDIIYANGNTYTLPQGSGGEIIITLDSEGIIKELSGTDEEGEPLKNPEIPLWLIGQSIHEIDWANIIARSETDVPFLDALTELATMLRNENSSTEGALAELASSANKAAAAMNDAASRFATTQIQVEVIGGVTAATGNVSGLALAEGNTSLNRLNLGARLAGKTLVGELGPELAVYDGMYHLLGQNGAEFVDLPSDAIVFNHRQTAGIIRGQVGYRGTALAEGNVDDLEGAAFAEGHITGPARAGIDQTIGQLKSLRAMWQNILDMDASQLAQAGGGGGGGNSLKATTADLEEWYNLMRQIEQIEQEITNLEAKRANIYDGSDYLKNLRETQKLLEKQRLTQQRLYEYQQKQLQAQADFINQHEIWSKFLTVGEDGLLQYIKGNEQVGGKGTIEVLSKLNEMSGAEQEKFVKSLGYTAKDEEGKALEGEKLVARFYEELQDQIDQYKELYETVHTTEAELEDLTSQIEDINREVVENQKELETNIYDIIVDAWEKEIGLLEEQAKLVEEANKAYTDGLKKALGAERDLYEENKSTEERESLQRQLALLRRSGGSAAEIADLEEQLDDALKDEYFKTQEKMIENIEDANERQVKKLEEQITLQKEALEYEKDNGIIWTKVYDVLRGSQESILAFMQGNSTEQFFSKSALEQEEMLLDWAKKIGIYSEDQQSKTAMAEAEKHWNSEAMWSGEVLSGLQGNYENLSDEQKADMAEYFKKSYSDARLDGSTEAEAQRIAEENIKTYLTEGGTGTGIGDMGGSSGGSSSGQEKLYYGGYTADETFVGGNKNYVYGDVNVAKQYAASHGILVDKGSNYFKTSSSPVTPWKFWHIVDNNNKELSSGKFASEGEASSEIYTKTNALKAKLARGEQLTAEELRWGKATVKFYQTGGLVDYTGLAMVHGSKSKPEAFLNAAQTAQIKEALQATHGKENLLEGLHSTIAELRSLIHNISTINNSTNYEVSIAPGAVVINVDELANSYDVEELSADIMNRMAAIASKATNRGVSRR